MSFFNDFLKSVSIDDIKEQACCSLVFDKCLKLTANFKVENLQEDEIVLRFKKNRIKILGKDLSIISLSKGEIEIEGKVDGVVRE